MNQDKMVVEFHINDQGEVKFNLAPLPTKHSEELVFTPIHEGQPAIRQPMPRGLKKWLKTAKPVSLEDLEKMMRSTLPPDSSTIGICNKPPS